MSSEVENGDEWQNNLDRWREKRRQEISKKAQLVETSKKEQEEDHRKRIDDIRHNIKRIQKQRVSISGISQDEYSDNDEATRHTKSEQNSPAIIPNKQYPLYDKENHSCDSKVGKFSLDRPFVVRKEGQALKIGDINSPNNVEKINDRHHEADIIEIENEKIIENLTNHLNNCKKVSESLSLTSEDEESVTKNPQNEKSRFLNFKLISKPGMSKDINWGITLKSDSNDPTRRGSLVRISAIKMGSSADLCELKKGDILISVNGKKILDSSSSFLSQIEVEQLLKATKSDTLLLTIRRSDEASESDEEDDETEVPKAPDEDDSITEKTNSTKSHEDNQTTQIMKDIPIEPSNMSSNCEKEVLLHEKSLSSNQIDQIASLSENQKNNNSTSQKSIDNDLPELSSVKTGNDSTNANGDSRCSDNIKLTEFNHGSNDDLPLDKKIDHKNSKLFDKNLCTVTYQTSGLSYDVIVPPEVLPAEEPIDDLNGLRISSYDPEVISIDCVNNRKILTKMQMMKEQSNVETKYCPKQPKTVALKENKEKLMIDFSPIPEKRGIRSLKEDNSPVKQTDSPPLPPRSIPRTIDLLDGVRPYTKSTKLNNKKEILDIPPRPRRNSRRDTQLKLCNVCRNELGTGALMIIQSLELYYHLECFSCCSCLLKLCDGNSDCEVRIKRGNLYCNKCYSLISGGDRTRPTQRHLDSSSSYLSKNENSQPKNIQSCPKEISNPPPIKLYDQNNSTLTSHFRYDPIRANKDNNKQQLFQDLLQPYQRSSDQLLSARSSLPHYHEREANPPHREKTPFNSEVQIHSRSFVGYF